MRAAFLIFLAAGSVAAEPGGIHGLPATIETPIARPWSDGITATGISVAGEDQSVALGFQIAPRVAAAYRFSTALTNGVERTDPAFDLHLILREEDQIWPGIAVGVRELFGTGRQGSEYIAATKTIAPEISVTGGLGWGGLAGETREDAEARLRTDLFSGDPAPFAGAVWTPGNSWRVKAEYSETGRQSPWNFGIERDIAGGVDLGVYSLGGEEIGFRLTLTADPNQPVTPQDFVPGPVPIKARPAGRSTAWAAMPGIEAKVFTALKDPLAAEGIEVRGGSLSATRIDLAITNTRYTRQPKALGRTARILASALPPSVEVFALTLVEGGLPTSTTVVKRSDLEGLDGSFTAGSESWARAEVMSATGIGAWVAPAGDRFDWGLAPRVPFGLSDQGLDFDLLIEASARMRLGQGLSLSGTLTQSVLGGFQDSMAPSGSLPAVRSNAAAYASNRPVVERLTADWTGKLAPSLYASVSAGMLERMFGGIGAEILWKDAASPVAFGVDLNAVQQRDPDEMLGFADYETVTGHASAYWETRWNGVAAEINAGRYLAEDWGATVTLSRRFRNGWEVAGFVTATDADVDGTATGARLTIPLQWTSPIPTRRRLDIGLRDVTRDDGARLDKAFRLYPAIRDADRTWLERNWEAYWQ